MLDFLIFLLFSFTLPLSAIKQHRIQFSIKKKKRVLFVTYMKGRKEDQEDCH